MAPRDEQAPWTRLESNHFKRGVLSMRPTRHLSNLRVGNPCRVGGDLVRRHSNGNAQSKRGRHPDDRVAKVQPSLMPSGVATHVNALNHRCSQRQCACHPLHRAMWTTRTTRLAILAPASPVQFSRVHSARSTSFIRPVKTCRKGTQTRAVRPCLAAGCATHIRRLTLGSRRLRALNLRGTRVGTSLALGNHLIAWPLTLVRSRPNGSPNHSERTPR